MTCLWTKAIPGELMRVILVQLILNQFKHKSGFLVKYMVLSHMNVTYFGPTKRSQIELEMVHVHVLSLHPSFTYFFPPLKMGPQYL